MRVGLMAALACPVLLGRAAVESMPPEGLPPAQEAVSAARLTRPPAHPRLLAGPGRWRELGFQIKTDPATAEIFRLVQLRGEKLLRLPPVDYHADPHNILGAVRDAERRILTFSIVYRLTGETTWLEAARGVMRELSAQPWPRGHFLDVAEAAFALSLGYDWLYDMLPDAEREAIAGKIHRDALLASVTEEEQMKWIWSDHNWNQVCHGGLVVGALAICERDPALASRIIHRALANIPRAASAYEPDGVYPEGPTYWAYGTTFQLLLMEALGSALGMQAGGEEFPGLLKSGEAVDRLTGPSGQFFNFADSLQRRSYKAAALWFALQNQRPDLVVCELQRVRSLGMEIESEDTRELPLFLLWWRPLPVMPPPAKHTQLSWRGEGIQPVAVLLSAPDDPLASWLAIKGGTASHSHAHMDAGSFVFESMGVRWALDLERDDYAMLRNSGYRQEEIFSCSQESRRWTLFRFGPEGHNILRFDAAPQDVEGHAKVGPICQSGDAVSVQVDLGPSYRGQAAYVRRTASLRPGAKLILSDEWMTLDHPAEVTWQWLTLAKVTAFKGGLLLKQDGRTLRLQIEVPENPRVEVQEISQTRSPEGGCLAPEVRRILIKVKTPSNSKGLLRVAAIPETPP